MLRRLPLLLLEQLRGRVRDKHRAAFEARIEGRKPFDDQAVLGVLDGFSDGLPLLGGAGTPLGKLFGASICVIMVITRSCFSTMRPGRPMSVTFMLWTCPRMVRVHRAVSQGHRAVSSYGIRVG
jgi:hypothetical protein